MNYLIRTSVAEDAALLAPKLRQADLEEVEASTGAEPLEVLEAGIRLSSPCRTLEVEGEVAAIFGAAPHPQRRDVGIVWLLASDRATENVRKFMRLSRQHLGEILAFYSGGLTNWAMASNDATIKWLEHLGAQFVSVTPAFGVGKKPFAQFVFQHKLRYKPQHPALILPEGGE